ncbi:ATPase, AAA-type, core domain and Peroxisome biogenesis factor 1, N-terminal domain and P-loop containing nucleoside triphosphate hydrolase domain-containing protein [Strongyloides ratti]|uniref:ATPase, AAA-type, core domain and Peroxisome biogenesis factor 1, N-terminal domain and P-loop containing nucleoside triphosphate hydrolase domain-containing protein n=1 Tax=Strongyloides ratti TaxID=34506 RepID=A0A090KWP7_STRRB|nr:ATPase, AAA-type, core domain and Peroxisome biogenesis factor 1, N-terminal domain and P-loop containing nucleoside triphosphate hydrolase domain-containing protein [Strongyloides ratti]CEF61841.1 ATPase, AAA-type, core domain and Peroxisome biogenesis factor 1, N-terminal domain and P-loop containing nucleoside triphosphate hydrolase domain-containing protein [Strongyloides ratti]
MSNILAIISFHNQSNSKGILSLCCDINHNTIGKFIGVYKIKNESKSIVQNIYSVDNCENKYLIDGNYCYLHINSILGNIYGFKDKEVVEMEFIGIDDFIVGKVITLSPKSEDDYKIIDETSSLIEEIFLNQINVLQINQEIILWIQDNLYVTMIVKNIKCDCTSTNNIYKLNDTTEIIVEVNKNKEKQKIIKNNSDNKYFHNNLLKINQRKLKDKVYRILDVHELSYSTILVNDESIDYGLYIVYVDHLNGSFEGCLKNVPSEVPIGHCFIPKHFNVRAYSKIIVNSIPFNNIKKINEIILKYNENFENPLLKSRKNNIEKTLNFSSEYSAIVIGCNGIFLSNNNEKLVVKENDCSKKIYGYFFTDSFPKIKIESTTEEIKKIEKKNGTKIFLNFGKELDKIELFDYQKKIIDEILKYFQYMNTQLGLSNIILLKGKEGSGKSTIIEQLSKHLFEEKYIFSLKINCLDIRNKKPSKIIENFQNKLLYLKTTYPSLLVIDNFDGITFMSNNDEDRIKSKKKLVKDIFYLMKTSDIPIIITSCTNDFISLIEDEYIG